MPSPDRGHPGTSCGEPSPGPAPSSLLPSPLLPPVVPQLFICIQCEKKERSTFGIWWGTRAMETPPSLEGQPVTERGLTSAWKCHRSFDLGQRF